MERRELKKIEVGSVYKVVLYLMILPAIVMSIIGLFMSVSEGGNSGTLIYGLIGLPLGALIVYGPISMLVVFIYNLLAKKFGGLVYYTEDTVDEETTYSGNLKTIDDLEADSNEEIKED